jgi:hypothetical protein
LRFRIERVDWAPSRPPTALCSMSDPIGEPPHGVDRALWVAAVDRGRQVRGLWETIEVGDTVNDTEPADVYSVNSRTPATPPRPAARARSVTPSPRLDSSPDRGTSEDNDLNATLVDTSSSSDDVSSPDQGEELEYRGWRRTSRGSGSQGAPKAKAARAPRGHTAQEAALPSLRPAQRKRPAAAADLPQTRGRPQRRKRPW